MLVLPWPVLYWIHMITAHGPGIGRGTFLSLLRVINEQFAQGE